MKHAKLPLLIVLSLLCFPLLAAAVQEAGETVDRRGTVNDDYYAAGGTVAIDAKVNGDVVAVGGTVTIDNQISEDVNVAGGTVTVRGQMQDDVRVGGANLTIDADVGDDLMAVGGVIEITSSSRISGKALLAGGTIDMNGTVNEDMMMGGGEMVIAGTVHGNVVIGADRILIKDSARIDGDLTYQSPRQADIRPGAVVAGKITYNETEEYHRPPRFSVFFPVVTLTVAGIAMLLVFPNFTQAASARLVKEFWKNLGLGFALLVATPVAAIVLMALVVGLHVGLPVLLLYAVALLVAFLLGAFYVANYGARLLKFDTSTRGRQIAALIGAMLVLILLCLIPVLGGLMIFVLWTSALGAGTLQLYEVYRGGKNVAPAEMK